MPIQLLYRIKFLASLPPSLIGRCCCLVHSRYPFINTQVLCVDGKGQDCTELVKNAYSLGLGWQASTDSYNPAVQMFSSPHIAHQVSLMAVSEPETDAGPRLRALGLEQPQRPLPLPYLHTQQVDSF